MPLLMDRIEKKYMITEEQYENLLIKLQDSLLPDMYGDYNVSNIYFDNDNYDLIKKSIEKPFYKEKLRLRSYSGFSEDKPVFTEIKKKINGAVSKRRITLSLDDTIDFLHDHSKNQTVTGKEISNLIDRYDLYPSVFLTYNREAYTAFERVRVTFDTEVKGKSLFEEGLTDFKDILPEDKILMEIKCQDSYPLELARTLSEEHIFSTSFSKYGTFYIDNILQKAPEKETQKSNIKNEEIMCL